MLFVHVLFAGLYSTGPGVWQMRVMWMVPEVDPPGFWAQAVTTVVVASKPVAIPQLVPCLVQSFRPAGKVGLISQDMIAPEPFKVAFSGKSLLWLPIVSKSVLGE